MSKQATSKASASASAPDGVLEQDETPWFPEGPKPGPDGTTCNRPPTGFQPLLDRSAKPARLPSPRRLDLASNDPL